MGMPLNIPLLRLAACLTLLSVLGCDGSSTSPDDPDPGVAIVPATATVIAGEASVFTAQVSHSEETQVVWSVSGGEYEADGLSLLWTAPMEPGSHVIEVALASGAAEASADVEVVAQEGTLREDFNEFLGTLETLPEGFQVTGEDGSGTQIEEGFNPFTGVSLLADGDDASFEGFGAFSNGSGGHSFGIRERGDTDLRESRLFLEYTNTADRAIVGFKVWYDVEVWLWGQRANRIRLKYNRETSGFSDLPDLASTDNPRGAAPEDDRGTRLDGLLPENRETVELTLDLLSAASVPDADGDPIGALGPGEVAYFRWQYSNTSGDGGSLRSGLAINNLLIVPIYADD